jgi:hypothetical protein
MDQLERDEERGHRIEMEAIADAYDAEEPALGWYYYLDNKISFPFRATCIRERRSSPLRDGEEVEAIRMAPEDDCMHEMFVIVRWDDRALGVPLAQLQGLDVSDETEEAIADWHYWVGRGYELG